MIFTSPNKTKIHHPKKLLKQMSVQKLIKVEQFVMKKKLTRKEILVNWPKIVLVSSKTLKTKRKEL